MDHQGLIRLIAHGNRLLGLKWMEFVHCNIVFIDCAELRCLVARLGIHSCEVITINENYINEHEMKYWGGQVESDDVFFFLLLARFRGFSGR